MIAITKAGLRRGPVERIIKTIKYERENHNLRKNDRTRY